MAGVGDDQSHARDIAREGPRRKQNLSPEALERKRAYNREWAKGPQAKEYAREYRQRPEVKQRTREYLQRPDVKQRERDRNRRAHADGRWFEREKARHLLNDYGLGVEIWNRMWREQGGLCAICRRAPATHVDHDHQTGRVRSLLCSPCNTAIGRFGDDPVALRAAADYLEHHAAQESPYVQERLFDA